MARCARSSLLEGEGCEHAVAEETSAPGRRAETPKAAVSVSEEFVEHFDDDPDPARRREVGVKPRISAYQSTHADCRPSALDRAGVDAPSRVLAEIGPSQIPRRWCGRHPLHGERKSRERGRSSVASSSVNPPLRSVAKE